MLYTITSIERINIIVGNITGDVLHPLAKLVIEKMDINTGYYRMYNIGTDEKSSRGQNYQK